MKQFRIEKTGGKLLITKSRVTHLLSLVFMVAFFAMWYRFLLFGNAGPEPLPLAKRLADQPFLWLFILTPLLLLPQLWSFTRIVAAGEVFAFDRSTDRLLRNQAILCPMSMIDFVQVRVFSGEHTEYRVSIVCRDGAKHRIAQGGSRDELFDLAEEIADYAGVKVVQK